MNTILRISLLLLLTLCVGSACAEVQQIDLVCEKYTGNTNTNSDANGGIKRVPPIHNLPITVWYDGTSIVIRNHDQEQCFAASLEITDDEMMSDEYDLFIGCNGEYCLDVSSLESGDYTLRIIYRSFSYIGTICIE